MFCEHTSDHYDHGSGRRFGSEPRRQVDDWCGDHALVGAGCRYDGNSRSAWIEAGFKRGGNQIR
jgi:hypothetical protein